MEEGVMAADQDSQVQTYCKNTLLYVSADVTTNIVRRIVALTGDWTKALKTIILAAGSKN
jgi:hypothetical protein